MSIAIDFDDFNSGDAVRGSVSNRRIYDTAGNDVTNDVLDTINAANGASLTAIPSLLFAVGPGTLDDNGEMQGSIVSTFVADDGSTVDFEDGNFYAMMAGDDAEEIVGIVVVEGSLDDVTARETGGFIVYR